MKWKDDQILQSGQVDDVGYEVTLYDKTVKVKQHTAAMDHARVKGKHRAWRRRTKAMVKGE